MGLKCLRPFDPFPFRSACPRGYLKIIFLVITIKNCLQNSPDSVADLVGMNEATRSAQMTRKAPKTKGGPGTNCKKLQIFRNTILHQIT